MVKIDFDRYTYVFQNVYIYRSCSLVLGLCLWSDQAIVVIHSSSTAWVILHYSYFEAVGCILRSFGFVVASSPHYCIDLLRFVGYRRGNSGSCLVLFHHYSFLYLWNCHFIIRNFLSWYLMVCHGYSVGIVPVVFQEFDYSFGIGCSSKQG